MSKDSINTSAEVPVGRGAETSIGANATEPVLQTLFLSVILLVLVSLIKYHSDRENDKKDYWQFFYEFPLDLGLVFISLFVSYYYLVSNINWLLIIAFAELLAILVGAIIRNVTQKKFLTFDKALQPGWLLLSLSGEVIIVLAPAIFSLSKFLL